MTTTPAPARLAFYGDDFTGSTDALEVLAFAGLSCALFLKPPTPEVLTRFGRLDAIGLAGASRGMTPAEMDAALPAPLAALARLAPIVHYKVCSTFDSAPGIGSIGRVMQIAREHVTPAVVPPVMPIVAGNPALGRYCLFGHLFARSGTDGRVYRIDRHPIMSVHPVTPMDESDLTLHLVRQAPLTLAKLTLAELEQGRAATDAALQGLLGERPDGILFDAATPAHLTEIGRLLENEARRQGRLFVVGSSGVQYALTQWWGTRDGPGRDSAALDRFAPAERVLAVSGSASELTAMQIDAALQAGFVEVALDARALVDEAQAPAAAQAVVARAVAALEGGASVLLHTARGPRDPRIAQMLDALLAQGLSRERARHEGGRTLGLRLGAIVQGILARVPLRRLLLAGGDTSSLVTQVLAPDALTVAARLVPGAPLCRLHAGGPLDGVEVALKGGQMGGVDFFERARRGRP